MPWRNESFELPESAITSLLKLAELKSSDRFVDLGSGTGAVVLEVVRQTEVKTAIGVEIEKKGHEAARRRAIENLSADQLRRADFWYGDIHSEDFDYGKTTVAYNSFEEDEEEVHFYRERFVHRRLRVLKKDLPLVGYESSMAVRMGQPWLFRIDFPLHRVRSKSEWAHLVLDRRGASVDDVYDYYRRTLSERGITKKEIALALNQLERLVISRF